VNELRPIAPPETATDYMKVVGWERIRQGYAEYLHDESRLEAERVEAIHFPETAGQVAAALREARSSEHRVAVSGGRTGITGAAVPFGAQEIISLERVKPRPIVRRLPQGGWCARVGAGTTLAELADALTHGQCDYPDGKPERALFYPIDSTETSAHLGGTIATNASGARTLYYGPTRRWVERVTVVTPDARILDLRRGRVTATDGTLVYGRADGTEAVLNIPDLPMPETKHTAGYYLAADMDALDLFVGSEGTLGIVVEADLRLAEKPANRLFLTQFVEGPDSVVPLVVACKGHPDLSPLALEYIDPRALALLRARGRETPAYLEVARLPETAAAALYLEAPFEDEDQLDRLYKALTDVLGASGLDPGHSWAGFSEKDMDQMKRLRHAVPETVNAIIARRKVDMPELHKVGTDMAVPDERLATMIDCYERRLQESGMDFVIFGHIGSGHLHVNILPRTAEEIAGAEGLYAEFAAEAVRLGGSVAAEHGIGRIKRKFLPIQFSADDLAAMRAVKDALDPDGILNPGVLFEA